MGARYLLGLGAVLLTIASTHSAPSRCTPVHRQWLRSDTAGYVIARLEADSAIAALWKPDSVRYPALPDSMRERRRRIWLERGQPVYGQWAVVERATDPSVGSRVLVLSWGLGSLCDQVPSGRAYVAPPGTRIFIEARARRDSGVASGAPVVAIQLFTNWYFQSRPDRAGGADALSVDEYEALHRALPTRLEWSNNPERAAEQIRRWFRTNEPLARRLPARYFLEEVDQELAWEKERRARKPRGTSG